MPTLAEHRKQKGLTQAQLAVHAGVAPATVWRIENGSKHVPDTETINRLADVLGIHPTQILLHEGESTRRVHVREPEGTSRQAEPAETTQGKEGT